MALFSKRRSGVHNLYDGAAYNSRSMLPRWTTPPDKNSYDWFKAFGENPRLQVVDRIASDLSYAEGKLFQIDRHGNEKEILVHPFLDFWMNPNPLYEFTSSALWRLAQIYQDIKGEGYFLMERDLLGRPAELWPIPTHWVQMVPYAGFPFYTIRLTNGMLLHVSVDDIFVMKTLNPLDPYKRGLGKAESIADEIEIDEYAAKFQKKFFHNDATPSTLIAMPNSDEKQRRRFLADWRQRFKGFLNSHGVAVVNGDVTVHKLMDNMKDMDMLQGRVRTRDATLEHFNMPREIMGITESSNRATSEAAQFIYAQNVLMPRLREREDAINQQIMPYFGPDLFWRFDDIVPRNQEFDKTKAIDGWNAGLLTKNEGRVLLDMDEVEGGDIYKTQFSDVFVRADQDPVAVSHDMAELQFSDEPAETDDLDGSGTIDLGDIELPKGHRPNREQKAIARRQALQKSMAAARREQERRFEVATKKYFKEQEARIGKALAGGSKADTDVWTPIDDWLTQHPQATREEINAFADDFVTSLIDWGGEAKLLEALFKPLWAETYSKGADVAKQAYGMAIDRPELYSFAKLRGGARIKHIEDTTKASVGRIVADGIEAGDTRETISRSIQQEMNTTAGRARVIAQTETHTSLMAGNMDMLKAGGMATKTWLTVGDGKVRPSCKSVHGKTVPIDETFPNGLRYPGDPECTDASKVVGCRCDVLAGDY